MKQRFVCLVALLMICLTSSAPPIPAGAAGPTPPVPAQLPGLDPDGVFVVRVYYDAIEDIRLLAGFDLFEYNNAREKYVLAAVDQAALKRIQALGFRAVLDPAETAGFTQRALAAPDQVEGIPGYPCYRTVEETFASAQAIVDAHPTLATWSDEGDSWEKSAGQPDGYDMMVLKLTNTAIPGNKPKVFMNASIHAREYTPAELATRFAEHLVGSYGVDADATWLLDHHEIHLMLHTNPDGRKEAEAGRSWRKNTNENYCGVTSTSRGADLNRNFGFRWGCCGGSSGTPCDGTYRGPTAGSEPETQAVQDYVRAIFPDQRDDPISSPAPAGATGVYIDLHSYSQLVLWPWGFQSGAAPNGAALQTLGRKFAYFNSYTPQQSYQLYVTDGTTIDFAYGELGVAAYTFELGTAFFQSCTTFENTILPANLPALIYAAKVARTPYQTPAGPDARSLAVSPAGAGSGEPATLTATIDDTRYRNTNGTEPTQAIAAAEYYVDTPPWQAGATAIAMAAADGAFNSSIEGVTATVSTTGLSLGRHMLFVRGKDANGNWGAFSAVFLDVAPCTAPASVSSLAIARRDSQKVDVTWSAAAGAARYEVWSAGGEPFFTPGADCADPAPYNCTSVTGTSFTDASLGSPATHTVYLVRSVSGCGAVADPGPGRVGEFEYALLPGTAEGLP